MKNLNQVKPLYDLRVYTLGPVAKGNGHYFEALAPFKAKDVVQGDNLFATILDESTKLEKGDLYVYSKQEGFYLTVAQKEYTYSELSKLETTGTRVYKVGATIRGNY